MLLLVSAITTAAVFGRKVLQLASAVTGHRRAPGLIGQLLADPRVVPSNRTSILVITLFVVQYRFG
jgi:hypothetical protein